MTIEHDDFIRESFPVGPLGCNCTILGDKTSGKAIIVDPGGDPQKIMERVAAHGLKVERVIHTHAHVDHFLASGEMKKAYGVSLALHRDDFPLWQHAETQCMMLGLQHTPLPDPDAWLQDDEDLGFGGVALHTPGHSPGSMSFYFGKGKLLIAGDTLFRGSIGRTDLWGGDSAAITQSIRERLYRLDETATVITGHGPETTIGYEMRHNQLVRA